MKKLFFYMVAAAIALTSCSSEDVVEVNNNGNAIDFRVAMGPGANSRGLETTKNNIKEFFVTAVYDESHGNYFANELYVVEDNVFNKPENRFMWPTEKLNFYAYSHGVNVTETGWDKFTDLYPTQAERESVFGNVTIEYGTQKFSNFSPNSDISKQIDFVTAKASGTGTDDEKENGVKLIFNHVLSQIQIQAFERDPEYIYNIRGVKIVNVISKDEFNMGNGYWLNSDPSVTEKPSYTKADGNLGSYAIEYPTDVDPIVLTEDVQNIMLASNGSAMLIPQQLDGWDPENVSTTIGAYIAVLLQVKMKGTNTQAYPLTITGKEYAWALIPISTNWKKGYKYVYTLDFSNGAGYDETTGKKIFDGTISFTCDETPWAEENQEDNNVNM